MPRDRIRADIRDLDGQDTFSFACHPGVACFTECCRDLELALSPYDVLRLCRGLAIDRDEFLERFAFPATIPEEPLPQVLLAMDDDTGRCPFVGREGCRVYDDRPAACRLYPLARGTRRGPDGRPSERYALVREPHCLGFADRERTEFSPAAWLADQGLTPYVLAGDLMLHLRDLALDHGPLSGEEAAIYLRGLFLDPLAAGEESAGEETLKLLKIRIDEVAERIFTGHG